MEFQFEMHFIRKIRSSLVFTAFDDNITTRTGKKTYKMTGMSLEADTLFSIDTKSKFIKI